MTAPAVTARYLHERLGIEHAPVTTTRDPRPGRAAPSLFGNEGRDPVQVALARLPDAVAGALRDFGAVLARRRSTRLYEPGGLGLDRLAGLLQLALGARANRPQYGVAGFPLRAVACSGGVETVEAYVLARAVVGLDPGIYRYRPLDHSLATVTTVGSMRLAIRDVCRYVSWIDDAPVVLALVGRIDRLRWKYGPAAYRLVHLDAGVAVQTLYLVAAALGLGACAAAGFDWRAAGRRLGLDPADALTVAAMAVGEPAGAGQEAGGDAG